MVSLRKLVKSGGTVLVGTPDATGIDLARGDRDIHALHMPYHRHILAQKALVDLGEASGFSPIRVYGAHYANTWMPFLNARFVRHYMKTRDDTIDSAIEPPRLGLRLLANPASYALGLFGAFFPPKTDISVMFRAV
jgi:hypothetical protein